MERLAARSQSHVSSRSPCMLSSYRAKFGNEPYSSVGAVRSTLASLVSAHAPRRGVGRRPSNPFNIPEHLAAVRARLTMRWSACVRVPKACLGIR